MTTGTHIKPPLYGLVLCGGQSSRMGQDKGLISYHGIPQREFLYKLLSDRCERTFMSIRSEQLQSLGSRFNTITDKNQYRGPYNGLLSAHIQFPEAAWLVLACDLPLMDEEGIRALIDSRKPDQVATAFTSSGSELPEPLAAIWEPAALKASIAYLRHAKSSCPRKFLINSETALVKAQKDEWLTNANSQEDLREVNEKIKMS
ncbi:NTP transferase domain-containing protein [Zeaxanthinibacter enoshimensis]|uniref:NTP transferase domain-containing protein n=1 Tax=Zeaxanthinibacter enoshimensis TaxID=392009 RepID=UPI00105FB30F|nr:NTP transferase domain-containing protein [Zeaxanthinibacter enoshimensis]